MHRIRLAGLAALLLLGACATTEKSAPEVPSLAGTTPSASAPAAGRPQIRLDSTEDETLALWDTYADCLVKHGVKELKGEGMAPAIGTGRRVLDRSGEPKAAYVTCEPKKPLGPPELDENLNPNYAAQWNDNVQCLRKKGLMVHVTEPGSWTYDSSDTAVPDNAAELEKECLLEAFSAKK
jgi:hypothetical protein